MEIPGINDLETAFLDFYGTGDTLVYDDLSDITFIYGSSFRDLIKYLSGEIRYDVLPLDITALLVHERQHFIDLCHTPYGFRQMLRFERTAQRVARMLNEVSSPDKPLNPESVQGLGLELFHESHLNTSGVQF